MGEHRVWVIVDPRPASVHAAQQKGEAMSRPSLPMGWCEEYVCGCQSPIVHTKRELPGYCPKHGDDWRNRYQDTSEGLVHAARREP